MFLNIFLHSFLLWHIVKQKEVFEKKDSKVLYQRLQHFVIECTALVGQ